MKKVETNKAIKEGNEIKTEVKILTVDEVVAEMIAKNEIKAEDLVVQKTAETDKAKAKKITDEITRLNTENKELKIFTSLLSLGVIADTTVYFKNDGENFKLGIYYGMPTIAHFITLIKAYYPGCETELMQKATEAEATIKVIKALIKTINSGFMYETISDEIIPQKVNNEPVIDYTTARKNIREFVTANKKLFSSDIDIYISFADTKTICDDSIKTTANTKAYNKTMVKFPKFINVFQSVITAKVAKLEAKQGKNPDKASASAETVNITEETTETK